jgi:branched-chain amino acid transport system permease protein
MTFAGQTLSFEKISLLVKRKKLLLIVSAIAIVFGFVAPSLIGKYEVDTYLDFFLIYVVLAESYDILGGFMGYVDLGITVFYSAGAYFFAIYFFLIHWSAPESFALATILTALLGFLVSFPMFRLKGFYFAVATLALVPLGEYIVEDPSLFNVTGGVGGINGVITISYQDTYYAILVYALFVVALIYVISKTRFGLALTSIREDEQIAESSGINTRIVKKLAMTISATLCGFTGCLFAWSQGSIVPSNIFSLYFAFIPVTFALFGGTGTILGPIIGSAVYSVIDYILNSSFIQVPFPAAPRYEEAIVGVFLIIVGLFAPGGIMQLRKPLKKFFFGPEKELEGEKAKILKE